MNASGNKALEKYYWTGGIDEQSVVESS